MGATVSPRLQRRTGYRAGHVICDKHLRTRRHGNYEKYG